MKGIIVSTETGRIYPLGEAAAHLIGYMQNGEGKAGLEKLYDEQLSGTNGLEIYIEDSNGTEKTVTGGQISDRWKGFNNNDQQ